MSWETVLGRIEFWSTSSAWSLPPSVDSGIAFSLPQQDTILGYLSYLYTNSATARALLEAGTPPGSTIKLFQTNDTTPGAIPSDSTGIAGINFTAIENFYSFNRTGQFVRERPELVLIHELFHAIQGIKDPNNSQLPTDSQWNAAGFDNDGDTVRATNTVAIELGWPQNERISYGSAIKTWNYGDTLPIAQLPPP